MNQPKRDRWSGEVTVFKDCPLPSQKIAKADHEPACRKAFVTEFNPAAEIVIDRERLRAALQIAKEYSVAGPEETTIYHVSLSKLERELFGS